MAFKRYDPKTKDTIMNAAKEVRAAGKTWAQAHDAAKAVGYKGSPEGLDVMIRNAKQKTAKAKPKSKPAAKSPPTSTKLEKPLSALRYDPKAKTAITAAAASARSQGKTWAVAHSAAKDAGYKGSVQGLVKMIQAAKKKSGKRKAAAAKVDAKPASRAKPLSIAGYDPVHAMIDQIVKQKLKAVVDKAIAELKKAVE